MKRALLSAVALGFGVAAGVASAFAGEPNIYVSGEGGASFLPELRLKATASQQESFDPGYLAGGALGYDTGFGVRIELNSLYQQIDLGKLAGKATTGHVSSTGIMLNAMYDLLPDERFSPYFGIGAGLQNLGGQIGTQRGRAWKPAYQGEVGLRQDVSKHFTLFAEYRYTQSESVRLSDATTTAHQPFEDHAMLAGFRIKLY